MRNKHSHITPPASASILLVPTHKDNYFICTSGKLAPAWEIGTEFARLDRTKLGKRNQILAQNQQLRKTAVICRCMVKDNYFGNI